MIYRHKSIGEFHIGNGWVGGGTPLWLGIDTDNNIYDLKFATGSIYLASKALVKNGIVFTTSIHAYMSDAYVNFHIMRNSIISMKRLIRKLGSVRIKDAKFTINDNYCKIINELVAKEVARKI